MSARKVPLDFFGWHTYAGLKDNIIFANYPRQYLDKYGYTETEIHLNEWNPGIAERGNLKDASNILGVMISQHATPTDMCMYYDFRWWSSYCGAVNPLDRSPFKAYYAFYNFGQLYALGNNVECSVIGNDVYALAATNGENGGIAVSNNSGEDVILNVTAIGLENKTAKMVPGADIAKDPTVTVKADSEDCWLFVEVKAENGVVLEGTPAATDFLTCEIASDWVKIGAGKNGGIVYGRKVTTSKEDQKFEVLAGNKVTVLSTVTKAMMETAKTTAPKLTFTAYAIQQANLGATTAAEAWDIYINT